MTKCKKRSMMLPEIKSIRGEQLRGTLEAQRLAWSGVQCPGNCVQILLREAAQVAAPLGRYCRNRPLVFSLMPRCQGLCGSAKYTFTPVAAVSR